MAKALLSTMLLIILILAACSKPAPTEISTTAPEPYPQSTEEKRVAAW